MALRAPLAWYILVTVCDPLLNGSLHRDGSALAEHAFLVTAATLCIFTISSSIMAIQQKRVDMLKETKEKGAER
jgi:hypothetical protein